MGSMSDGKKKDKDDEAKVTIWGAEWCPPCHAVKRFLDSHKIAYKYVDVDKDRESGIKIAEKTGWTSIPIINIGEEYIVGFDIAKLNEALRAAKLV